MRIGFYFIALVSLVKCVTLPYEPQAREVKRRPTNGGVIALNLSHRQEDRARADIMMKSNCGNLDVQVAEEGEVVVGERLEATTDKHAKTTTNAFTLGGFSFGNEKPTETTTTNSVQVKEWQIAYNCIASTTKTTVPVATKSKKKSGT